MVRDRLAEQYAEQFDLLAVEEENPINPFVGGVTLYVIGIAVGFIIIGQLLAWVSRERTRNTSLY